MSEQAIVVRESTDLRLDRAAFEPSNNLEAYEHAKRLCSSGLMPKAFARPEQVYVAIVMGRELGLSAMQAIRSIYVVEGKPSMSADLIIGLVKKSPTCLYFQCLESTSKVARYGTQRQGNPAPTIFSFSWEDAEAAGVTGKDNWRKWPAAMLRARCAVSLARAEYPDIAMGLYDPDELATSAAQAPRGASPVFPEPPSEPPAPPHDLVTGEVLPAPAEPKASKGAKKSEEAKQPPKAETTSTTSTPVPGPAETGSTTPTTAASEPRDRAADLAAIHIAGKACGLDAKEQENSYRAFLQSVIHKTSCADASDEERLEVIRALHNLDGALSNVRAHAKAAGNSWVAWAEKGIAKALDEENIQDVMSNLAVLNARMRTAK